MARQNKGILLKDLRWSKKMSFEYHLIKLSIFFAQEHIFTVFPECRDYVNAMKSKGTKCSVYLITTFQSNDGELVAPSSKELHDEKAAFDAALIKTDKISSLISYNSASVVWKDASREVFFDFLDEISALMEKAFLHCDGDAPPYFLDGPDPASGVALRSQRGPTIMSDADIIDNFFPFDSVLIAGPGGGCRMASHPIFGLSVYPSSLVVAIPESEEEKLKALVLSVSSTA